MVAGNPSKLPKAELEARRAEEAAVKARPIRPKKPGHLSKFASEAWDDLTPELERLGLLTLLDSASFYFAVESYALARTALEELRPRKADGTLDRRAKGLVVTEVDRVHGGMLKKHPAVAVYLQASGDFRRWCSAFGLTPSDRLALRPARPGPGSAGGGSDDGDDVGAFLGY